MKRILYSFVCLLLAACSAQGPDPLGSGQAVTLGAGVDDCPLLETRAPYSLTVPDGLHPLVTTVWASTEEHTFSNTGVTGSVDHGYIVSNDALVEFRSGYAQVNKGRFLFPVNGSLTPEVYFVGFAPGDPGDDMDFGWTHTEDAGVHKASRNFNGKEDIMFAPEVSGHYTGDVPVLHFYHLLTWLQFKLVASSEEASAAWGKLKDIHLVRTRGRAEGDLEDGVTISLDTAPGSLAAVWEKTDFTASGDIHDDGEYPLYQTASPETPFPSADYSLPFPRGSQTVDEVADEAAYVLCPPVIASSAVSEYEYWLTLNTEHRKNVSVPLDLKAAANTYYAGNTMGRAFLITLKFTFGNVMANAVGVTDWPTGAIMTIQPVTD